MKKITYGILLMAVIAFILFVIFGFVFASPGTKTWAGIIWLSTFSVLSLTVTGTIVFYAVIFLRKKNAEIHRIAPDDNGNFAVVREKKQGWINLNLLGANEHGQAWAFWQATNNKSFGTPARELFQQPILSVQKPLGLITAPGESDVIDAVAEEL